MIGLRAVAVRGSRQALFPLFRTAQNKEAQNLVGGQPRSSQARAVGRREGWLDASLPRIDLVVL